ncbi:MAG: methyltransferase domain-containing protein [Actinomycetota bacterium]|nr:methyltransferase domain-containing protein [Actinomycetota bacterium]
MQSDTRRERRGSGRLAQVSSLLTEALTTVAVPGRSTRILDCGGGSGAYAVPLALAGADVTVLDISADALATLRRRADEAGVSAAVHAVAGDVEALPELIANGQLTGFAEGSAAQFDVVLAHGILDAVDGVELTFATMAASVRPGGLLSVLVGNPVASVLSRALAGEPALALDELRRLDDPGHVGPDAVGRLAERSGLRVEAQHGIGVFSDLVTGWVGDSPGGREALASLDAEAAARSPFAEIAGRVHLLLRRSSD